MFDSINSPFLIFKRVYDMDNLEKEYQEKRKQLNRYNNKILDIIELIANETDDNVIKELFILLRQLRCKREDIRYDMEKILMLSKKQVKEV